MTGLVSWIWRSGTQNSAPASLTDVQPKKVKQYTGKNLLQIVQNLEKPDFLQRQSRKSLERIITLLKESSSSVNVARASKKANALLQEKLQIKETREAEKADKSKEAEGAGKSEEAKEVDKSQKIVKQPRYIVSEDGTKFNGLRASLKDIKNYLDLHGDKVQEIVLGNADDPLMALIKEKCLQLNSFRLLDYAFPTRWTEQGLSQLAKMPKLSSLSIAAFSLIGIETKAIIDLLASANLTKNITDLYIPVVDCDVNPYAPINKYTDLKKLSLVGFEKDLLEVL